MENIKHIGLFISSPSDVIREVDSIRVIVDEINKTSGRQNYYFIEALNWIVDTYTQIGEDAQDVINKQIDSKYDILVAVFWQKLGTPTKRDISGTVEQINSAIKSSKHILIYFNRQPPESIYDIDVSQLSELKEFKKQLSTQGVLYKEYDSLDTFESLFRIQLNNLISEQIVNKIDLEKAPLQGKSDLYSPISDLISNIENNQTDKNWDIDIFQLTEQLTFNLESVGLSMDAMSSATNDLTQKLNKRTEELNRFTHVKDSRLRLQKLHVITDLLADELTEYNSRINNELPRFSENLLLIGPAYSLINQFSANYSIDNPFLKENVLGFRDSIQFAMEKTASLLIQILKWPPASPKFNKAKRETEIALKNITKGLLESLKLMDESLGYDPNSKSN